MKDKQLNFWAFWAINDELVTEKACTQLMEMKWLFWMESVPPSNMAVFPGVRCWKTVTGRNMEKV